jgi:hypothetical protein
VIIPVIMLLDAFKSSLRVAFTNSIALGWLTAAGKKPQK